MAKDIMSDTPEDAGPTPEEMGITDSSKEVAREAEIPTAVAGVSGEGGGPKEPAPLSGEGGPRDPDEFQRRVQAAVEAAKKAKADAESTVSAPRSADQPSVVPEPPGAPVAAAGGGGKGGDEDPPAPPEGGGDDSSDEFKETMEERNKRLQQALEDAIRLKEEADARAATFEKRLDALEERSKEREAKAARVGREEADAAGAANVEAFVKEMERLELEARWQELGERNDRLLKPKVVEARAKGEGLTLEEQQTILGEADEVRIQEILHQKKLERAELEKRRESVLSAKGRGEREPYRRIDGREEKQELLEVTTAYGSKIEVVLPESLEGKIDWMRRRLEFVERTAGSFGSNENYTYTSEIYAVINQLQKLSVQSSDPETKRRSAEAADKMSQELMARSSLHEFMQVYTRVDEVEALSQAMGYLRADHFNTLFRIKEVQFAFMAYEDEAGLFIGSREKEREEVQDRIAFTVGLSMQAHSLAKQQLEAEEEEGKTFSSAEERRAYLRGLTKTKIEEEKGKNRSEEEEQKVIEAGRWAQVVGERLWRITGRAAAWDGYVDPRIFGKDSEEELTEEELASALRVTPLGEYEFRGEGGGDFVQRRVLRFKQWMITNRIGTPTVKELWKYIKLNAGDAMSKLPGELESNFTRETTEKEVSAWVDREQARLGRPLTAEEMKTAQVEGAKLAQLKARARVERLIGYKFESKKDENGKEIGRGWDQGMVKLDNIDFDDVDFRLMNGQSFFSTHNKFNLIGPEGARAALVGKSTSFLRQPSGESLVALAEVFGYRQKAAPPALATILNGFINLGRSKEGGKYNLLKMDLAMADSAINLLAKKMGLERWRADEIAKDVLGDNFLDNVAIACSYFKVHRIGLVLLLYLLLGALQQGFSTK